MAAVALIPASFRFPGGPFVALAISILRSREIRSRKGCHKISRTEALGVMREPICSRNRCRKISRTFPAPFWNPFLAPF